MLTEKKLQELVGLVREEEKEKYVMNWLKILQEIGQMNLEELNQFDEAIGLDEKEIEEIIEKQYPNFVLSMMVILASQKSKLLIEQCYKEKVGLEGLSDLMVKSFPRIFLVQILVNMLVDEIEKVKKNSEFNFRLSYITVIALAALQNKTWKSEWDDV